MVIYRDGMEWNGKQYSLSKTTKSLLFLWNFDSMLRNPSSSLNNFKQLKCLTKITTRGVQITTNYGSKNASGNLGRQSRVINKLFGTRISGSKKRWVPSNTSNFIGENVLFKASQFGKSSGAGSGKNTSRRMAVLNKLFMKHITDLLATGEASEAIVGRGMQVTRVKISPDFSYINVYWLANGDPLNESDLEKSLSISAGYIRHELSQLYLMSEVPKIKFLHDKTYFNTSQIENVLQNIDLSDGEEEVSKGDQNTEGTFKREIKVKTLGGAVPLKQKFFGEPINPNLESSSLEADGISGNLPVMRHDVLGLDHRDIMSKITVKMRKSKQAWEAYNQNASNADSMTSSEPKKPLTLEEINESIALAAEKEEKFKEFLAKRREKKTTPERKKYRASDHLLNQEISNEGDDLIVLAKPLKQLYEMDDYIEEDEEADDDKDESKQI